MHSLQANVLGLPPPLSPPPHQPALKTGCSSCLCALPRSLPCLCPMCRLLLLPLLQMASMLYGHLPQVIGVIGAGQMGSGIAQVGGWQLFVVTQAVPPRRHRMQQCSCNRTPAAPTCPKAACTSKTPQLLPTVTPAHVRVALLFVGLSPRCVLPRAWMCC